MLAAGRRAHTVRLHGGLASVADQRACARFAASRRALALRGRAALDARVSCCAGLAQAAVSAGRRCAAALVGRHALAGPSPAAVLLLASPAALAVRVVFGDTAALFEAAVTDTSACSARPAAFVAFGVALAEGSAAAARSRAGRRGCTRRPLAAGIQGRKDGGEPLAVLLRRLRDQQQATGQQRPSTGGLLQRPMSSSRGRVERLEASRPRDGSHQVSGTHPLGRRRAVVGSTRSGFEGVQ